MKVKYFFTKRDDGHVDLHIQYGKYDLEKPQTWFNNPHNCGKIYQGWFVDDNAVTKYMSSIESGCQTNKEKVVFLEYDKALVQVVECAVYTLNEPDYEEEHFN